MSDEQEVITVDEGQTDLATRLTGLGDSAAELTRYKTKELRKRFEELFGIAHLLPWAGAGLAAPVVVLLTTWLVVFMPRAAVFIATLTFSYMLLQGLFLGVLAAALLVGARILQQLSAIVDITIQTLREALKDLRDVNERTSVSELANGLLHGALLPAAQSVITVKLGFLRLPISFVINRLLRRTARKLTKSLKKDEPRLLESDKRLSPAEDSSLIKASLDRGETHLDRVQQRVELIARRTRRATLIPATILFVITAWISSIPWIIALLFLL